jgi:predicted choloylglycine hydrolase
LAGDHDVESRFLSLWCPPPYLAGCSQIAWNREGSYLLRNYDYGNDYFDGVLLYSNWLQPVIGMVDCTWGLLDGVNGAGLAASLTFGGRKVRGEGFGIPLVLRYILETCSSVEEALKVLRHIPVHMSYNVTLIEASGAYATLFLNPDRPPEVIPESTCTNHQRQVEWTEYADLSATLARKEFLDICAAQPDENVQTLLRRFLNAPLYSTRFDKAFGTLYTVVYDAVTRAVGVHWPTESLLQSMAHFTEEARQVNLVPTYPGLNHTA